MPYTVCSIANTLLDFVDRRSSWLSNMKMQKMLYICQGVHLAVNDTPCFNETVEAWQYGPVVSSIYHQFKQYGAGPIRGKAYNIAPVEVAPLIRDDEDIVNLIEAVWTKFGRMTALQLSSWSHAEGSPWHSTVEEVRKKYPAAPIQGYTIREELISNYFKEHVMSKKGRA